MRLEMWEALPAAVERLVAADEVRVLVVRGEGAGAFSAGADIAEFPGRRTRPEDAARYGEAVVGAVDALAGCRKPTIALLHGAAAGGGAGIALACALRFADDRLRFSIPAAQLGVVYEGAIVSRLVETVGASYAFDLLASARTVGPEEALR